AERIRTLRETQRRHKEAAEAAEAADMRAAMARRQYAASLQQALVGVTQMARGLAMLGVANEEDTKRLLQKIVVIESLFSVVKGGIQVYRGLTAAANAYRVAQEAIATASAKAALARGAA